MPQYSDSGMSRPERVGLLIREEIASLLITGLKDPRIGMATVTHVGMSRDLRQARVYVSIYGDDTVRQSSLDGLAAASGYIRRELGRCLRLRHIPQLTFKLDDSAEYGARMERVFKVIANGADEQALDNLSSEPLAPVEGPRDRTPAGGELPSQGRRRGGHRG